MESLWNPTCALCHTPLACSQSIWCHTGSGQNVLIEVSDASSSGNVHGATILDCPIEDAPPAFLLKSRLLDISYLHSFMDRCSKSLNHEGMCDKYVASANIDTCWDHILNLTGVDNSSATPEYSMLIWMTMNSVACTNSYEFDMQDLPAPICSMSSAKVGMAFEA